MEICSRPDCGDGIHHSFDVLWVSSGVVSFFFSILEMTKAHPIKNAQTPIPK